MEIKIVENHCFKPGDTVIDAEGIRWDLLVINGDIAEAENNFGEIIYTLDLRQCALDKRIATQTPPVWCKR